MHYLQINNLTITLNWYSFYLIIQTNFTDLQNNWEKEQCAQFIKPLIEKIQIKFGQFE